MIEWIFFDLGSTLLDEEAAYGYYIDKCVKKLESLDIEVSSDSWAPLKTSQKTYKMR